jgi:succinate-acetate transporter protein
MFLVPSLGIKEAYNGNEKAYSFALGIFLILWCFLTLLFLVAALRTSWVVVGVLFFLTLAFFFLALAQFTLSSNKTASRGLNKTGGAMSVICAFLAFWAGAAGIMTEETTTVRIPLYAIGRGTRSTATA